MTGRMPREALDEAAKAPEPVEPAPPVPAMAPDADPTKPPGTPCASAPCEARRKRLPKFVL